MEFPLRPTSGKVEQAHKYLCNLHPSVYPDRKPISIYLPAKVETGDTLTHVHLCPHECIYTLPLIRDAYTPRYFASLCEVRGD